MAPYESLTAQWGQSVVPNLLRKAPFVLLRVFLWTPFRNVPVKGSIPGKSNQIQVNPTKSNEQKDEPQAVQGCSWAPPIKPKQGKTSQNKVTIIFAASVAFMVAAWIFVAGFVALYAFDARWLPPRSTEMDLIFYAALLPVLVLIPIQIFRYCQSRRGVVISKEEPNPNLPL